MPESGRRPGHGGAGVTSSCSLASPISAARLGAHQQARDRGSSAVAGVFGIFALIEIALVLVLVGTLQESAGVLHIAGVVVFVFAAVGVYLFFNSASQATGGSALPLGPPLVHG